MLGAFEATAKIALGVLEETIQNDSKCGLWLKQNQRMGA